jgi:hypothetical protein
MEKIKSNFTERSKCCGAKIKVVGRTALHYECLKCKEPCDIYIKERKIWARNPKTQILGDKRAKTKNKLTKKEVEDFRKNEDF